MRSMRSLRLVSARPLVSALRTVKPLRASMATAAAPLSAEEKKKLIDQFPYPWPWGQTVEVEGPKRKFTIRVMQDAPAPKQHKLAYKIDPAPPELPPAPSIFIGVVGKASHALFAAALKNNSLDAVKESIAAFAAMYEAKHSIKMALLHPRTSLDDKIAYVKEVAASVGADAATTDVLVQLFKDKKLHKMAEVSKNLTTLISEHRKERHGAIISAEPLSEKQYDAITAKMQKLVGADETLIISRDVEPALVGGFIIRIGNRAQDLSVAAQITRMEAHLKQFFAKNKDAVDKVLA